MYFFFCWDLFMHSEDLFSHSQDLFIHSPNPFYLQSRPSFLKLVPSFIYCLPFYFLLVCGIFKTPKKPPYFQWRPFYFETGHSYHKALYSFCQLNMFCTKTYINEGLFSFKSMSLQTNWTLVKNKWQFAQLVDQLQ